jgi:hypothetical protein
MKCRRGYLSLEQPQPPPPPPQSRLFNRLTTESQNTCSAGYAMIPINDSYSGPIFQMRKETEIEDIYYDGNQYKLQNNTELTAWLNGATPYIVIWYNQINGAHATQTDESRQPLFDVATYSVFLICRMVQFQVEIPIIHSC